MIQLVLTLSGLAAVTLVFGDIAARQRPHPSANTRAGRDDPDLDAVRDGEPSALSVKARAGHPGRR